MSEMNIKVSDDFLLKVADKCGSSPTVRQCCTAFAEVLSENPIVPSIEDINAIGCAWFKFFDPDMDDPQHKSFRDGMLRALDLFQRRMFLVTEPEVLEEIKDLLLPDIESGFFKPEIVNERMAECFRRGQRAGSK
jgi:hypothetical protein